MALLSRSIADDMDGSSVSLKYVVAVSFDAEGTVVEYFTKDDSTALPDGATGHPHTVSGISGGSQSVNEQDLIAAVGGYTIQLSDYNESVTNALSLHDGQYRSLLDKEVKIYVGKGDAQFDRYVLADTQIIKDVSVDKNVYTLRCSDLLWRLKKEIFETAKTTLQADFKKGDTTLTVASTDGCRMLAHGPNYTDAPNKKVGYVIVNKKEVVRYISKTANTFTVDTGGRGALGTLERDHVFDTGNPDDSQITVEEVVFFELPIPKAIYGIVTGALYGQEGEAFPWGLNVDPVYIHAQDFTKYPDWWNTQNDKGVMCRVFQPGKVDAKNFIEKELLPWLPAFMPTYGTGEIGLKRRAEVVEDASYDRVVDSRMVVSAGALLHDYTQVRNDYIVDWSWSPFAKEFKRTTVYRDNSLSYQKYGRTKALRLSSRALDSYLYTANLLRQRLLDLHARYAFHPVTIELECSPKAAGLEIGKVYKVDLTSVKDYTGQGSRLKRSMELQEKNIDWVTGRVRLRFFGSTAKNEPVALTSSNPISSSAYSSFGGVDIATLPGYVNVAGVGYLNAGVAFNGNTNLLNGVYRHTGNLVISVGTESTLSKNVFLVVDGDLQIDGKLNGKGGGLAGGAGLTGPAVSFYLQPGNFIRTTEPYLGFMQLPPGKTYLNAANGSAGFIGNTRSGGGVSYGLGAMQMSPQGYAIPHSWDFTSYVNYEANLVSGQNSVMPTYFDIKNVDGDSLTGLPVDLQGSSGSGGCTAARLYGFGSLYQDLRLAQWVTASGGDGGAGGAGLAILAHSVSFGVAGEIDLSGNAGQTGQPLSSANGLRTIYAGSGAGGHPGGLFIILADPLAPPVDIQGHFKAFRGDSPIQGTPFPDEDVPYSGTGVYLGSHPERSWDYVATSAYVGMPAESLWQACSRVQYVPSIEAPIADSNDAAPVSVSGITIASGTQHLVKLQDGTILTGMKVTWTPSTDRQVDYYEVYYSAASGSGEWVKWSDEPSRTETGTLIFPVTDGETYYVRVRSVNVYGYRSDVPAVSHLVVGKQENPTNVASVSVELKATSAILTWPSIADKDLREYVVKYGSSWGLGTEIYRGRATSFIWQAPPIGTHTLRVKAVDTTEHESTTEATTSLQISAPNISIISSAFNAANVKLTWDEPSSTYGVDYYILRYGATWETSTLVGNIDVDTYETTVNWTGSRTFWVAAVDRAGYEGAPNSHLVSVTPPAAVTWGSNRVIDNTVLLKWAGVQGALPIKDYEIRKGAVFASAEVLGRVSATFKTFGELEGGTYTYWISAIDTAGNYGVETSETLEVSQPPDFELNGVWDSALTGTIVNGVSEPQGVLFCVNTSETWDQHFVNNSWTTSDAQVAAGFPYYAEPSQTTGYYEETFDYGAVVSNTTVQFQETMLTIHGSITVTPKLSVKLNIGDAWQDFAGTRSKYYVGDFRYVKVRLDFSSSGGDDLSYLTALQLKLFTKLKSDQGKGRALSTDTNGTVFTFNKAFIDIQSIVVSPLTTDNGTPVAPVVSVNEVIDFVDAPNPTQFKVYLFNSTTGARVSRDITWQARGV